jgi:hypothetical protein
MGRKSRKLKSYSGRRISLAILIRRGLTKQVINSVESAEPELGRMQPSEDKNSLLPIPDIEMDHNPN